MHMRLAISIAAFASVDGLRRRSKEKAQSNSEMRNDIGPVVDRDSETLLGVHASDFNERFENQIHEAKMSQIWWKVIADTSPAPLPSVWKAGLAALQMMGLRDFFEQFGDEKPMGEAKILHLQAVACKFSMKVWDTSPFTGIFAPGTTTGLMRMGPPAPDKTMSGVSLKWFRSYVHSGNTVLAATGESENFFEKDISNHIQIFASAPLLLLRKIMRHTICSGATGLYDLGMYDQNGNSAGDNLNFPFELFLEPANRTLAAMPAGSNYTTELWKLLGAIPVGTKLFNVKVRSQPGSALEQIGELNLASQCTNSKYADQRLAFKHFKIEDDLSRRPEWTEPLKEDCDNKFR